MTDNKISIDSISKECNIDIKINDIYTTSESRYSTLLAKATEITNNITETIKSKLNFGFGSDNEETQLETNNLRDLNLTVKCKVGFDESLEIPIEQFKFSSNIINTLKNNNILKISNIYETIRLLINSTQYKNNEPAIIELFEQGLINNKSQVTKFINNKDAQGYNLLSASIDFKMKNLSLWLFNHPDLITEELINSKNKYNNTALFLASCRNYSDIVEKLLEFPNIDVNIVNDFGETALYYAIFKNNEKIAVMLLKHPKINLKYIVEKNLIQKALTNSTEIVALILFDKIFNSNYVSTLYESNSLMETLLIVACKRKYIIFANELLFTQTKAKKYFTSDFINKYDAAFKTALDYCAINQLFGVANNIIKTNLVDGFSVHFNNDLLSIGSRADFNTIVRFINAKQSNIVTDLVKIPFVKKDITDKILIEEMLFACEFKDITSLHNMLVYYQLENHALYCDSHHNTVLMYTCMYRWTEAALYILSKEPETELFFKNKSGKSSIVHIFETGIFELITLGLDKVDTFKIIRNPDCMKIYQQCLTIAKKSKEPSIIEYMEKYDQILKEEIKIYDLEEKKRMDDLAKEFDNYDNSKKKDKNAKKKAKKDKRSNSLDNIAYKINTVNNINEKLTNDNTSNNSNSDSKEEQDCDELILNSSFNKNIIKKEESKKNDIKKDVKTEVKKDVKTEVKPEVKPEVKKDVKTEVKPEVKLEVKKDVKTEVKPEVKKDVKTEVKKEVKSEVRPEVKKEVKKEVKLEVKPEVRPEVKPEVKLEIKPEIKPEIKLDIKKEVKPEVKKYVPPKYSVLIGNIKPIPGLNSSPNSVNYNSPVYNTVETKNVFTSVVKNVDNPVKQVQILQKPKSDVKENISNGTFSAVLPNSKSDNIINILNPTKQDVQETKPQIQTQKLNTSPRFESGFCFDITRNDIEYQKQLEYFVLSSLDIY